MKSFQTLLNFGLQYEVAQRADSVWEGKFLLASQETAIILSDPKFHYRFLIWEICILSTASNRTALRYIY
jgi:hypothetical protein